MKLIRLAVTTVLASLFAVGCAVSTEETEAAGQSSEELSRSAIAGGWAATSGPIYTIDFTNKHAQTLGGFLKGYEFTANVDTGVRCIKAPCPQSQTTVTGVYKLTGTTVTLASFDKPTAVFGRYLGDYKASIKHAKLTLHKTDDTVVGTFEAGDECGQTVCGGTTVCCNPLMNICVAPGKVCIQ